MIEIKETRLLVVNTAGNELIKAEGKTFDFQAKSILIRIF